MDQFLGIVENGHFRPLEPKLLFGTFLKLTNISREEARSPESGALDLSEYEGATIMVQGDVDSDWLYWAQVIDRAPANPEHGGAAVVGPSQP